MSDLAQAEVQSIKKHRGIGIASFVLGLVLQFYLAGLVIFKGYLQRNGLDSSTTTMAVGVLFFLFVILDIIAFIFGVYGMRDSTSKKLFPALGAFLSAWPFGAFFAVIVYATINHTW